MSARKSGRTYRFTRRDASHGVSAEGSGSTSATCIVPAPTAKYGNVFLPFEDDRLSLILSKAFLLAGDAGITDPTILTQIQRGS